MYQCDVVVQRDAASGLVSVVPARRLTLGHCGRGLRAHVTSSPIPPYTRGALFGNTNPSVLCYTCDAADVTGAAPPSDALNSDTSVNNMTGDFTTSNTLFDAPAIGGDLSLTLNYDAQLSQSQLATNLNYHTFGEGWSSNFATAIAQGVDGGGNITETVDQGSGAQVTFTQSADSGVSTSCQSSGDPIGGQFAGDYYFTNKYTLSGSSYNFCALDSVQGQLSDIYATNTFTYEQNGGQAIQDYAWNGALEDSTSNTAQGCHAH